MLTAAFTL